MSTRNAAILLIGNEILSGKVEDANARYAIGQLHTLGVLLQRVVVVPDDIDDIADTVRELAARYDYVLTSGGVGPTHDDLTMQGVARAFGTRVIRNPELQRRLTEFYGPKLQERALRMADVPETAELIEADHKSWPVVCLRNVYVLPGIPEIFRRKFDSIKARFRSEPFCLRQVYVSLEESQIAAALDDVVMAHPTVQIGSYPRLDAPDYRVMITLESKSSAAVGMSLDALLKRLPQGCLVRVE